jgi:hypothetical protein
MKALSAIYPSHQWQPILFKSLLKGGRLMSKVQMALQRMIQKLLPGHEILSNHIYKDMRFGMQTKRIEYDVSIVIVIS